MRRKTAAWIAALCLAAGITACGPGEDKDTPQNDQTTRQEEMDEEQLERELQKMKEDGILDENGQPAPGVDLNDYPGLG